MSEYSSAINEVANGHVESKDQKVVINNNGMNTLELKHQDPNGTWVTNNVLVDSTTVSSNQRYQVYVNCDFSNQESSDEHDYVNCSKAATTEGLLYESGKSTSEKSVKPRTTNCQKKEVPGVSHEGGVELLRTGKNGDSKQNRKVEKGHELTSGKETDIYSSNTVKSRHSSANSQDSKSDGVIKTYRTSDNSLKLGTNENGNAKQNRIIDEGPALRFAKEIDRLSPNLVTPHRRRSADSVDSGGGFISKTHRVPSEIIRVHPSEEIKNEMRKVIGNLEGVLDELKHVVGDLRSVVGQIDDVTTQIEGVSGVSGREKCLPQSHKASISKANSRKNKICENSFDSGFVDSGVLDPKGATSVKRFNQEKDAETDMHIISDRSQSCDKGASLEKQNTAKSIPSCANLHACHKCHHFHYKNSTSDSNNSSSNMAPKCSIVNNIGKKKSPNKYFNKSLGSPYLGLKNKNLSDGLSTGRSIPASRAFSDISDFYERQLDQRLENISGMQDTLGADFYSTFDALSVRKKSYSDTLFNVINDERNSPSADTAYDSDSSEEGANLTDRVRDNVMRPSDTFRFKVRQIGMRRARAANWRVIIEP